MAKPKICSIADCGKPSKTRGWCGAHYHRFLRHGDPVAGRTPQGVPREWLTAHAKYQGDECLIWPFSRNNAGYGQLAVEGRPVRHIASRVMCEIVHGPPLDPSYEAAHGCGRGNQGCINPQHLRWATKFENAQDMIAHGTKLLGSRTNNAKLTEVEVRSIRSMKGKVVQRRLAEKYGMSANAISRIMIGLDWSWLSQEGD